MDSKWASKTTTKKRLHAASFVCVHVYTYGQTMQYFT